LQYGNSFTILLGHTVHTGAERLMNLSEIRYYENGVSDGCAHTTVILAASTYNNCTYCVAAHSVIAGSQKVPADVIEAIRNDQPITDNRLEALRVFTTLVVENLGWVSTGDIETFIAAGFTQAQVLEVILGISFKTLSNYINHIADTPLDEAFASQKWQSPLEQKAS